MHILKFDLIYSIYFAGEQHIENYHKNGQIPQLVEYVCGDEKKKKKANKEKQT